MRSSMKSLLRIPEELIVQTQVTNAGDSNKRLWRVYMCPHTTIYVSSYYYVCVFILLIYAYKRR